VQPSDVVVFGGGVAGLSAAVTAASYARDVWEVRASTAESI
jgi:Succinate dehydrogenase/fumarate reductase, flavoprotein subunit